MSGAGRMTALTDDIAEVADDDNQVEEGVRWRYRKQARAALLEYARHVQEGEK